MKAALLETAAADPVIVEDLICSGPPAGYVKVQVSHCGICHSDLTMIESDVSTVPMVLGHEAAGIVTEVGTGVRSLSEGDSVLLSPIGPCDHCYHCVRGETVLCKDASSMFTGLLPDGTSPFSWQDKIVFRGLGVGGFAAETVVRESAAVKIPEGVPRNIAAVMGCAVQTGVGAVLNTAKMEPGATALIMGLGGIGMSVLLGTKVAGASRVIVSDPIAERREMALKLGATDALDPASEDIDAVVRETTKGIGVDYSFDAVGNADLISTGMNACRSGGLTLIVGAPPGDQDLTIPVIVSWMITEKKLAGCLYGSSDSRREVPRLLDLYSTGRLDLESLITSRRPIEEISSGLADMREGKGVRTIMEL